MTHDPSDRVAVVVTSISPPNKVLKSLAEGCALNGLAFIVIGDEASPKSFTLDDCQFYSLEDQVGTGYQFAKLCPTRTYSRKNIGYLVAAQQGASIIVETDDDNLPYGSFWHQRERHQSVHSLANLGWLNVYRYFTDALIWPRGFPLDSINASVPTLDDFQVTQADCPIQQGLADDNPDVDAIYRLILPLPQKFKANQTRIALSEGSWCPFNSQNTSWWQDAFPLLYLPTYCSFRMTDIWRSFIAQKIAWVNGWSVLFHEPTVWQERNEHNLMKDFQQEIDGYLRNTKLSQTLEDISLVPGIESIPGNLITCYQRLIKASFFEPEEMDLLKAWLSDLDKCLG